MRKPFTRIKYKSPEKFAENDLIGHGEATSMITDLMTAVPDKERWDRRRLVDNHIRYAIRTGKLLTVSRGTFRFGEIATWANRRYGKENPEIKRMRHGVMVAVSGLKAIARVGAAHVFSAPDDYKVENERLRVALAESEAQREREKPDTDIGRKVRKGGRKGGNTPKEKRP
mgnify:CR=1 FL=1